MSALGGKRTLSVSPSAAPQHLEVFIHPVPLLSDLEWLPQDRFDWVCTAEFTISFAFDSKGIVQAHNSVELINPDGTSVFYNAQTRRGGWLFQKIVGRNVSCVDRPDDWTIDILFENGFRLVTRSEDGPFESGLVAQPGGRPDGFSFF